MLNVDLANCITQLFFRSGVRMLFDNAEFILGQINRVSRGFLTVDGYIITLCSILSVLIVILVLYPELTLPHGQQWPKLLVYSLVLIPLTPVLILLEVAIYRCKSSLSIVGLGFGIQAILNNQLLMNQWDL